jgi:uncharacterized protein (DUF433 family)
MSHWQPAAYKDYQWIVADPQLLGGKLAIRGTRLAVALVLECLAGGMSLDDINRSFDCDIPRQAVPEVLKVASELTDSFCVAEQANQRAKDLRARIPRALSAHYDHKTGRIVLHLSSNLIVSFSPNDVEGLKGARPSQLDNIEISPSGFGIHFPAVDADLYVPGLLEGFLGSKTWMASRLGQIGGRSSSKAKKAASRTNGRLGGRPKKVVHR